MISNSNSDIFRFFHPQIILSLIILIFGLPQFDPLWAAPKVRLEPAEILGAFGPGHMGWKRFGQYTRLLAPGTLKGGALLKLDKPSGDEFIYIFCDPDVSRLLLFREKQIVNRKQAVDIREYGRIITIHGYPEPAPNIDPLAISMQAPVDVAVSSCGTYYDPDRDFIFVVDREYHKVIKFRYDVSSDSLIWLGSFGEDSLHSPTSIDYADGNDSDPSNDKIYVADLKPPRICQLSVDGVWEKSHIFDNVDVLGLLYPSGISVATISKTTLNRIYICDERQHKIMDVLFLPKEKYGSEFEYEQWLFYNTPLPYAVFSAIDRDWHGNIFVADYSHHGILVSTDTLSNYEVLGPGQLKPDFLFYPSDIYIDGDEMIVCEMLAETTGLASFKIIPDTTAPELTPIPTRNYLHYPRPVEFSTQTKLSFDLRESAKVQLMIIDRTGRTVKTLVNSLIPAGANAIIWDGRDDLGAQVEPGEYDCKMIAAGFERSRVIVYKR